MAFDWFRRRYTQPSSDSADRETSSTEEMASSDATAETQAAETAQIDYLAFAKAAYANIKARQEEQSTGTASAAAVSETEDLSSAGPDRTPEISEPALDAPQADAEPEPEVSPAPVSDPTQAFFDLAPKATDRLQALEATATAEPEPQPSSSPAAKATTAPEGPTATESDLSFDAGFQWSAEILAAQGRRPDQIAAEEITWLQKLRRSLGKTRLSLINQLKALVGRGPIDQDAVDEIETALLQADVGVAATDQIIESLQNRMRRETLPPEEAVSYLKEQMRQMLTVGDPTFAPERNTLNIWLIVGVNGVGKTTTIGKIAHVTRSSDYRCLIAAADTFRAAAVEQLQIWGQRAEVAVIANPGKNTDPAAVVFDAVAAAQARQTELLLVDTAGRLQNKKNLMEELTKIRRIIAKKAPEAQVEALLVLDATLGQNGLRQAQVFTEAVQLSGVIITKLDSTAKGGIAFAITQQMQLPIRFIGAGEGIEDLRPFSSYEFVEALLSE